MKIHLAGIGGVGMAALAVLLKNRGNDVTGCDLKPTPRTAWLESQGISVMFGHSADHVVDSDSVVFTPAVPENHPEMLESKGRLVSRGAALARIVGECDSIAVCGSHGKTTTSTFVAKLLIALGESVEWAIGGETGEFPVAGRVNREGRPAVLVVEADESDGTLALYHARTLVVTNCEYDHPDHFKTPADYFACYDAARRQAGSVIEASCLSDMPELDAACRNLAPHNRFNARAAVEVALRRGHALADIVAALPNVVSALPDRRFQILRNSGGIVVVTDYAHHPTEMKCAVSMARKICTGRLRVLFQPHRYSRTKALLGDFPLAFEAADEVVLCPTYAAFEKPVEGGDIADLYAICRADRTIGGKVLLARSCREAWFHARAKMRPGDVTLLLGAGDIIALAPLVESWDGPPRRRVWIGAGSNTWRSDLATGEEYVKTEGRAGMPGAVLGIPWMAGIPGTVGGWIKMNAGASGHSVSEVLKRIKVDGRWINASECGFGYRTSAIDGEIQDFEFVDGFADITGCEPSAEAFLARRNKFPPGTKGSVFKNPPDDSAGRLLEKADCKGLRVGGAFVWERHANVIVSGKGANNSDFLALARLMHNRVLFRFGVDLQPEVCGLTV
jgi:UDP-N-acetylmuramate--alanine ligase